MAVQSMTIDTDADEFFARTQPGPSCLTVITQPCGPRKTAASLLRALPSLTLKEETLDQIEAQVKERRRHPARLPRL